MDEKDYIELDSHRAIILLPEHAVEVTVNAKVYEGGKLQEVSAVYGMTQIREMFRKADEGYIDDDDTFVLTDQGKAYLEELENQRK